MKKIGVFYGSSTGTTKNVAEIIAVAMKGDGRKYEVDLFDVADSKPSDVANYEVLILGSSTWGCGDLQDDWCDYILGLKELDLRDKTIALFGCGDETMSDTFCGAVGELYRHLQNTGAKFIAPFDASEYTFDETTAFVNGQYVGLLLDEVNHADLSGKRIKDWTDKVKKEIEE